MGRGTLPKSLSLIARLNRARRDGDLELAAELDRELDEADRRQGWTRRGGFTRDDRVPPVRRQPWTAR